METLFASFADLELAEKAAGALLDHGLLSDNLTLVANAPREQGEPDVERQAKFGITTTTSQDAAAGAIKGVGVGLGVGVAAVLATLFIPGFGLVSGGGALAHALAAGAATAAAGGVTGGVAGYLVDQGVPAEVANEYELARQNGGALLSVHLAPEGLQRAEVESLVTKYGAIKVSPYEPGVTALIDPVTD